MQRNLVYDIMKAIGIVLMIVGHMNIPAWCTTFIYSFHMPLFFFLAGFFMHDGEDVTWTSFVAFTKRQFNRLILPVLTTMTLLIGWGALQAYFKEDVNYFWQPLLSLLWGSSDELNLFCGLTYIGPVWFLIALFWAKIIAYILINKIPNWALPIGLLIYGCVIVLRIYVSACPWCLMQGLYAVLFVITGWRMWRVLIAPPYSRIIRMLLLLIWFGMVVFMLYKKTHLEMSGCGYVIPVVDVVSALGGTLFVYYIAKVISMLPNKILIPILWGGANTLAILCMHNFVNFSAIDCSILLHTPLICIYDTPFWGVFRFCLTFFFAWGVTRIPYIRNVFVPKKIITNECCNE